MTEREKRLLTESIETIRYFEQGLWERVKKGRKEMLVRPPAPSNQSLSWDAAIYHLVKFVENEINKESNTNLK